MGLMSKWQPMLQNFRRMCVNEHWGGTEDWGGTTAWRNTLSNTNTQNFSYKFRNSVFLEYSRV